ncbi:MAG: hypothetical protein LBH07_00145 [Treponema sp.]|jgi:exopolysaccharide biosynthesis protein|nr:hypothetical protein [Treponema sp.]
MGKKTYFINGKYFIVDEETGVIKRVIIQDDPGISQEDLQQLIKIIIAESSKEKNN